MTYDQSSTRSTTGTATSRARTVRPATRKPTKARLALSGPSGSGKTWTSLSIAEVIAPGGRVVVIDSEPSDEGGTAAELYADHFSFDVIDWRKPPYDPRDLALTVRELSAARATDVLIIDSASAFWSGSGGTLDIAGGKFGGWRTATPAQDDLVLAILHASMHVIVCTRARMDYLVEEGEGKKQTVKKVGLAPVQRGDLEYEFQVVGMLDIEHRLDIGKTRASELAGKSFPANRQADFANVYKAWLEKGVELVQQTDVDLIVGALNSMQDAEQRKTAKQEFANAFGKPDQLPPDRLAAVWAWLSNVLDVDVHAYAQEDAEVDACAACSLPLGAGWHTAPQPPSKGPEPESAAVPPEPPLEAPSEPQGGAEATSVGDAAAEVAAAARSADPQTVAQWVDGLKLVQVTQALEANSKPTHGGPKTLRKALTEFYLDVATGEATDKRACTECGGYKAFPPPGAEACACAF